ncbi:hypothetical protein BS47DRAFT_1350841 [Hydnum rufescens UP504]|uniref:Uncharacterized protein n=1 Tax=Hydnum rufescens UP504 TaxID=1448309 RepID=A0A9P6ALH7_9AGAM|nr:hypothetical protein BS47DRAFT_1350841 [Hydnum rufescens UP504]
MGKRNPSVNASIVEREKSGRLSNGPSLVSGGIQSRLPTPHVTPSNSATQDDLRSALITSATERSALLRGSPIRESGEYGRDPFINFDGLSSSPGSATTAAVGGKTENGGADGLPQSKPSNYGGTSLLKRD